MKYSPRTADKKRQSLENAVHRTLVTDRRGPRPAEPSRHSHHSHHPHQHDRRPSPRHDASRAHSDRSQHRYRKEHGAAHGAKRTPASSSGASYSASRGAKAYVVTTPSRGSSAHSTPRLSPRPSPKLAAVEQPASLTPPLDERLVQLLHAMAVTREAFEDRLTVIRDLQRTLRPLGLRVVPYGSVATGLLIPSSDLDCVMAIDEEAVARRGGGADGRSSAIPPRLLTLLGSLARTHTMTPKERKSCFAGGMRLVANAMRNARMFNSILTIAHAKVPIVKCRHRDLGVKVDLSFEEDGCLSSTFLINEFQRAGNELARPLIILVKAMIANWGLDDPSVGGLGSFPTSILVLFFLQTEVHTRYPVELRGSLGVLLCGFLKYYGYDFNYKTSGIDYVQRCTIAKPASFDLFVINPIQTGHNCARAASLYAGRVVPRFQEAYTALHPYLGAGDMPPTLRVETVLTRFFEKLVPTPDAWQRLVQSQFHRVFAPQHRWTEEGIYTGGPL